MPASLRYRNLRAGGHPLALFLLELKGYIVGMATDPQYRPITAEEFLAMDFGSDRKFELDNGVIHMMTGGLSDHAHVAGNIYFALRLKLGITCRPFNSDMGVRIDETTVRYPDISIVCRSNWLTEPSVRAFSDPVVVFEVLSPSTSTFDQGTKLEEYRQLTSVDTIVFVDPVNRLTRTFQRQSGDLWRDNSFALPHDVHLPALGITLTEREIFGQD